MHRQERELAEQEADRLERLLAAERARPPVRIYAAGDKLHPVAAQVQKHLEASTPDEDWGQLRCKVVRLPYVRTTPQSMPRALLILSSVLEAFDDRRWLLKPGHESADVVVDGERLHISVEETARRVPHKLTPEEEERRRRLRAKWRNSWDELSDPEYRNLPSWDFIPSNHFTVRRRIGSGPSDKPRQPLEGRFASLMSGYLEAASNDRIRRAAWEADAERSRLAEEARLAAARQREIDQAALSKLLGDADRWATAEKVRAYVRAALASDQPPLRNGSTEEWASWATHYADKLDPTRD